MNSDRRARLLPYESDGTEVYGPNVDLIRRLHRYSEDLVIFGKKDPTRHRDDGVYPMDTVPGPFGRHGAIRVGDLVSMFPQFLDELCEDAYFSVNGFLAPQRPGAPVRRKADFTSHINAVFADLDVYKGDGDLTPNVAAALILDLVEAGQLPPPSFFSFSGRGVWSFWILRTPRSPDIAPAAYGKQRHGPRQLWDLVMKAIHRVIREELPQLNLDKGSADLARYTRVPGSINTSSEHRRPVRYLFPTDSDAKGYLYTLGELADFFGIDTRPRITRASRTKSGKKLAKPARGVLATFEHRLADFHKLIDHRGPNLKDGQRRRMTLYVYAFLLKSVNATEADAWTQVERLAATFDPQLSEATVRQQFRSGWEMQRAENVTLAGYLDVTQAEADTLQLRHLRPDFQPKERKRSTRTEDRRQALTALVEEIESMSRPMPTTRELAAQLTAQGYQTSHDTVARDLNVLGIANSQERDKLHREQKEQRLHQQERRRQPRLFDTVNGPETTEP